MSLSANTFSRSRISLETSRPVAQNKPLSSSPPPHVFTRTVTNNIGRIWYLLMNSGSSSTIVMAVSKFITVLVKGYWIVAYQKQMQYAGMTIGAVEADPELIGKYQLKSVLMVPVLVSVCSHTTVVMTISGQSGGICLGVLSAIQLGPDAFRTCILKHSIQFARADQLHSDLGHRVTLFPSCYGDRHEHGVGPLIWHLVIPQ